MADVGNIGCWKLDKSAKLPFQGSELSACYDISACLHTESVKVHGRKMGIPVENYDEDNEVSYIRIFPGEMALVPTGLVFILPPTHHLKFYSRSGNVWKRMLKVANQPAVIDADYTLESFVLLHNQGIDTAIIKDGDSIAQCELIENNKGNFMEINNKNIFVQCVEDIERFSTRDGGLGSTDGVGGIMKAHSSNE